MNYQPRFTTNSRPMSSPADAPQRKYHAMIVSHYGREARAVRRQLDATWRERFAMVAIIVATILLIGSFL